MSIYTQKYKLFTEVAMRIFFIVIHLLCMLFFSGNIVYTYPNGGKRMQKNTISTVVLLLENGVHCIANAIGVTKPLYAELIFNTSMFGYQEIITDQSYAGQAIVFTMPHIGAVGCTLHDMESATISPMFIVVRSLETFPSNYRAQCSLTEFAQTYALPIVYNIDTRYITMCLRKEGVLRAVVRPITHEDDIITYKESWLKELRCSTPLQMASTMAHSVLQVTTWNEGVLNLNTETFEAPESRVRIVVYDFGLKYAIIRILTSLGAECICVPKESAASDVLAMKPDGICFSNGAGNPEDYTHAITAAKTFLTTDIPLLGICLGHQIFGLALGGKTVKMKFGHHGGNHPVQHCKTKRVYITSQNHGFAVDPNSLPKEVIITHISLFDNSLQGFMLHNPPLFAFQGHPEASPGPHDMYSLFTEYIQNVMNYHERCTSV